MADPPRQAVHLASESDFSRFRSAARSLLAQGVAPAVVSWHVATTAEGDLFGPPAGIDVSHAPVVPGSAAPSIAARPARAQVPAFFVPLCEDAALHRDPGRFGLMYRLLWRLVHEPCLRHDPLDADRMQVEQMARAVRRDKHKMTAFVRFRPLVAPTDDAWRITHVAWFEPVHHTLEATAPFFARRFAQMPWAILTPERSARWDGRALAFGPGARREDAPPPDADEQLWLTYYEHIFNPARLKLKMMQKEMPRRYWKNLPEASLIQPLTALSAQRTSKMIEQPGSEPAHRRPAASVALRLDQRADPSALAGRPGPTGALARFETLDALAAATERCRACPIGQFATQAVSGEGRSNARLMVVGEQPGDQEDLQGHPFVGPAGKMLDRAFVQLGWSRASLYLTNAVKHFKYEPRGKRRMHKTASQKEAAQCAEWLEHEIALVKPEAAIALGATAARSLLGYAVSVTTARGQWLLRADGLRVLIALHPAALLRMDAGDRDVAYDGWLDDLRQASRHV